MTVAMIQTCGYEYAYGNQSVMCCRAATWESVCDGARQHWCDEHKDEVSLQHSLDRGDEPEVEFHRSGGGR